MQAHSSPTVDSLCIVVEHRTEAVVDYLRTRSLWDDLSYPPLPQPDAGRFR
jgi:hypothetical protein